MRPSIAVVIPAYNRRNDLARALESVAAQTRLPDEVIVCDDGSQVDLADLVRSFERRLPMTFLRIKNSGGPARPRNVAIGAASCAWIALLDSDDWWHPSKIELLHAILPSTPADVVHHPLAIASSSTAARRDRRRLIGRDFHAQLAPLTHLACIGNPLAASAAVFRRQLWHDLGGFAEDGVVEDYDLWMRVAAAGMKFVHVPQVLGGYWESIDAISREPLRQIALHHETLRRQRARLEPRWHAHAQAFEHYLTGTYLLRAGLRERAIEHLAAATPLITWRLRAGRVAKLVVARAAR